MDVTGDASSMSTLGRIIVALTAFAIAAIAPLGCRPARSEPSVYDRLQSDNPSVRIEAITQAGRQSDRRAVPLLVDRLADDDADVRLFAQLALEKITGQTFGYRYFELPAERSAAVERWRAWLTEQVESPTAMRAGGG